jgi:drug/metabolite transporter (DMT)-like permease
MSGNLRGIFLMIASMAGFAVEDALIKTAAETLPVGQILILLGTGGATIFGLLAWRGGAQVFSPVLATRPVLVRNIAEMFGTMAFVSAIVLAPLSTVTAIIQATPLAVTLGAAVFLKAPVGWRRWTAILVGFAGVLLIVRPGSAAFDLGVVLAVIGVFGLAARDVATRAVPASVSSLQLATWGFASVVPAGMILLLASGGAVVPDRSATLALVGALSIGVFAYYAIIAAMRVGEIAVVMPFRYSRLVFGMAIGILVFGERPDALTYVGAAIVIATGLYTLIREARLSRAQSPLSPPSSGR